MSRLDPADELRVALSLVDREQAERDRRAASLARLLRKGRTGRRPIKTKEAPMK